MECFAALKRFLKILKTFLMVAKHDIDVKETNMILFLKKVLHNFLCEPKLADKK